MLKLLAKLLMGRMGMHLSNKMEGFGITKLNTFQIVMLQV